MPLSLRKVFMHICTRDLTKLARCMWTDAYRRGTMTIAKGTNTRVKISCLHLTSNGGTRTSARVDFSRHDISLSLEFINIISRFNLYVYMCRISKREGN